VRPSHDQRHTVVISVVFPYRDAQDTVVSAIESVLAEDVVGEVIAVDDGSCDDGPARVTRIRDARIMHLRTAGVGVALALRAGVERARGELIARMDADDISLPGRIAATAAMLESDTTLAAVACAVEATGAVQEGMRAFVAWQNAIVTPEDHARSIFVETPLCHPSVIIRRSALEAVGGYRDVPWAEDYDLWLRFDQAGFRLAKLPRVLVQWRQHETSTTRRDVRCSVERLRAARALYLAPRLRDMARPVAIWGAGPTGTRLARELEKHGIVASRFVDIDPRKIGRRRRGSPIVGSEHVSREHTVVVAVGVRGARDLVRAELASRGFVEGHDFLCGG
jgi:glycosyltransferase involved in cell wall biosynthesis